MVENNEEFPFEALYTRIGYPNSFGQALTEASRGLDVDVDIGCVYDNRSGVGDFVIHLRSHCPVAFSEATTRFTRLDSDYDPKSLN